MVSLVEGLAAVPERRSGHHPALFPEMRPRGESISSAALKWRDLRSCNNGLSKPRAYSQGSQVSNSGIESSNSIMYGDDVGVVWFLASFASNARAHSRILRPACDLARRPVVVVLRWRCRLRFPPVAVSFSLSLVSPFLRAFHFFGVMLLPKGSLGAPWTPWQCNLRPFRRHPAPYVSVGSVPFIELCLHCLFVWFALFALSVFPPSPCW